MGVTAQWLKFSLNKFRERFQIHEIREIKDPRNISTVWYFAGLYFVNLESFTKFIQRKFEPLRCHMHGQCASTNFFPFKTAICENLYLQDISAIQYTVKPPNNERIGTANFFHYLQVFFIKRYTYKFIEEYANGRKKISLWEVFHYWGSSLSEVPPYTDYLTKLSQLHMVLALAQQLSSDVQLSSSHKYIAHQTALLYVSFMTS